MSAVRIIHKIDDRSVLAALKRLTALGHDATDLFEDIGETLLMSTEERFRAEHDPAGVAWMANAASTKRRKRHRKILTESGDLHGSIAKRPHRLHVEIGSNLVYAAIHQAGGRAGRNCATTIPARPYLGVSDADAAEIMVGSARAISGATGQIWRSRIVDPVRWGILEG